MKGTCQTKHGLNIKPNVHQIVSISSLISVFGLTWLFAILTFSAPGLRQTFQILFTVFNSFQGLFIFLSFCVLDKKGFDSFKELLTCGMYKRMLTSSQASASKTSKQHYTGNMGPGSSSSNWYAPLTSKSATLTYEKEAPLQTKGDNGQNITVHALEYEQKTGEGTNVAAQFDEEMTNPTNIASYSVSTFVNDREMKKSTSLKARIKRYSATKRDVEELKENFNPAGCSQESSDERDAITRL